MILLLAGALSLVLLTATSAASAVAQGEDGASAAPVGVAASDPVEVWVSAKVSSGEPADLQDYSGDPRARVLTAAFVKSLLTRPTAQGDESPARITIKRAIIHGALVVRDIDLPFSVMLHDCVFKATADENTVYDDAIADGVVDFSGSVFQGDLSLERSRFGELKLPRVTTEGSLILDGASISYRADLSQARTGRELSVQDVRFLEEAYEGNFSRMHVDGNAYFNRSDFRGTVRFFSSQFEKDLEVSDSRFFFSHDAADFDRIRVGQSAWFRSNRFVRQASFRSMYVSNSFDANGSTYYGANFSNTVIGNDLSLVNSDFSDTVDISFASVGGTVDLKDVNSTGGMEARLDNATIAKDLNISGSTFTGPVVCRNSKIGRDIRINESAVFTRLDCSAVRVNGMVALDRLYASDEMSFVDAAVEGVFQARDARFNGPDVSLNLRRIAVKRAIDIDKATFSGRVDASGADVMDLKVRAVDGSLTELDLSGAVVGRDLTLHGWTVGDLHARSLQVIGRAVLTYVDVKGQANLQGARLGRVEVKEMRWMPDPPDTNGGRYLPTFRGASFTSYGPAEEGGTGDDFTSILTAVGFSRSAYVSWESYLRQQGDALKADDVWIGMRGRERNELYRDLIKELYPRYWFDLAIEVLTGYGRRPWNALIPAAIVVLIGSAIFSRRRVDPLLTSDETRRFNRLLFSLDKFMPVINLKVADVWRVKDCPTWIWWYQYVHTLLGWTIVPFVVATLTGIIQ